MTMDINKIYESLVKKQGKEEVDKSILQTFRRVFNKDYFKKEMEKNNDN